MGGLPWRWLSALAAIAACTALLAACGGSDDSSSSSTASTPATTAESGGETTSEATPGDESGSSPSGGESESGSQSQSGGGSTSQGRPKQSHPTDLPERGEVSSQSAEFQKYSRPGKLHLAEFGEEASSGDFDEVQTLVAEYLQATGAGEWEKACGYLLPEVKAQIAELAAQSKQAGNSCGETLQATTKAFTTEPNASPVYASEGISSLRIKEGGRAGEGAGFALFHGSDGKDHWMAVKAGGGQWRILSSTPQPFQ